MNCTSGKQISKAIQIMVKVDLNPIVRSLRDKLYQETKHAKMIYIIVTFGMVPYNYLALENVHLDGVIFGNVKMLCYFVRQHCENKN